MAHIVKAITLIIAIALLASCSQEVAKKIEYRKVDGREISCCPDGGGLLKAQINTGEADSISRVDMRYPAFAKEEGGEVLVYKVVEKQHQFKDYAPFIQKMPSEGKEILWFSSSRPGKGKNLTTIPTQLFYAERNVAGANPCPNEGWGEPRRFLTTDEKFNRRTFGAVAVWDNEMYVAAEQSADFYMDQGSSYLLNIYMITTNDPDGDFRNPGDLSTPVELENVNADDAWDTHPAISSDGKHMYFISDRPTPEDLENGDSARSDYNLWYSARVEGVWQKPLLVEFGGGIDTEMNEYTPQFGPEGNKLFFASNQNGSYDIYSADFPGGNIGAKLGKVVDGEKNFSSECGLEGKALKFNTDADDIFPFFLTYEDESKCKTAVFWTSNKASGYGNYDIYGCCVPERKLNLIVTVKNAETGEIIDVSQDPFVKIYLDDDEVDSQSRKKEFNFTIDYEKPYRVEGGIGDFNIDCGKYEREIISRYNLPVADSNLVEGGFSDSTYYVEKARKISEDATLKEIAQNRGAVEIVGEPITETKLIDWRLAIVSSTLTRELVNVDAANLTKGEVVDKWKYTNRKSWKFVDKRTLLYDKAAADTIVFKKDRSITNVSERTKAGYLYVPGTVQNCKKYDTVYVIPIKTAKPPCKFEFSEYWGEYRKKIPYFQTAFWEVNTPKNFARDISRLTNSGKLYTRPFSKALAPPPENWGPWNVGAKWIELHYANTYWGRTDSTDTLNMNVNRRAEYKRDAYAVDKNLNEAANIICDKLLPAHEIINKISPGDANDHIKFVIYVEAWSDYRNVRRGWYLAKDPSEKTIRYVSGAIIGNNDSLGLKLVEVDEGEPLGKYNEVLSDLRAYFGFKTFFEEYLLKRDNFKEYYEAGEVLTPLDLVDENGLKSESERDALIKKSKLIIMTKGYSTIGLNRGKESEVESYSRSKNKRTYFNLDLDRTISISTEPLVYLEGKFINDECCDRNIVSVSKIKNELDKYKTAADDVVYSKLALSFGSYDSRDDAEDIQRLVREKTGEECEISTVEYYDKPNNSTVTKYRVTFGKFNNLGEAQEKQQQIEDKLFAGLESTDESTLAISIEKFKFNRDYLRNDERYKISLGGEFETAEKAEAELAKLQTKINEEILNKSKTLSRKEYSKLYDEYLIAPYKVRLYFVPNDGKNIYKLFVGPFMEKDEAKGFENIFLKDIGVKVNIEKFEN